MMKMLATKPVKVPKPVLQILIHQKGVHLPHQAMPMIITMGRVLVFPLVQQAITIQVNPLLQAATMPVSRLNIVNLNAKMIFKVL